MSEALGMVVGALLWPLLWGWICRKALGFSPVSAIWCGYVITMTIAVVLAFTLPQRGDPLLALAVFAGLGLAQAWYRGARLARTETSTQPEA